ncbi:MauE/DoxX family redox-associated membrane protein [Chitinophaga flava]|uniref:Methylamine utilisation protein MauE domain-containing protein n=1 Tax=Chitinophaga flava TaxID=2259036 RepID=A0A365XXR2_9BACT|nr:MauE/DoxX family redox-associated membrane protein [Chitinophaga flava]RBL91113.1 hypothetical protein DF182_00385 [Chitinophaga flava]
MKKQQLTDIAVFAYILMFSYAAASKLFDLHMFQMQLKLQPFSESLRPFIMWGIPIVELLIVTVLLIPRHRIIGLKLATGLMIIFTGYISIAKMGVFRYIPCSCGGVISKFTWTQHLWFNLFFLVLGVWALLIHFRKKDLNLN